MFLRIVWTFPTKPAHSQLVPLQDREAPWLRFMILSLQFAHSLKSICGWPSHQYLPWHMGGERMSPGVCKGWGLFNIVMQSWVSAQTRNWYLCGLPGTWHSHFLKNIDVNFTIRKSPHPPPTWYSWKKQAEGDDFMQIGVKNSRSSICCLGGITPSYVQWLIPAMCSDIPFSSAQGGKVMKNQT